MSTPPTPERPAPAPERPPRWYDAGLKFACTACGNCCRNHGDYNYVYLREPEVTAIAAHLGLDEATLIAEHCERDRDWLSFRTDGPACPFLGEDSRCMVYPVRPVQCRTWPFWDETLRRAVWEKEVRAICPGAGTGTLHTAAEVEAIAAANERWYHGEARRWDGPEPRG